MTEDQLSTFIERPESCAETTRSCLDMLLRGAKIPGIQYLVVAPDRIVFQFAGGWADIAGRRRLNASTTMMAYSMSKTITAAAVLQLVEVQRVRLDDPIDAYLETQPYGPKLTVRHLLSHTSGIPNPIPLRWVHPAEHPDPFNERAALARVLRRHTKRLFSPGSRYKYSNLGYWLLSRIVERASGEPFQSYVRDHILQRLGITPQELGYVVPDFQNHAKGYLEKYSFTNLVKRLVVSSELIGGYEGRWLRLNDHYVDGAAFGGLVGTAEGFGKFLQDQLRPHSAIFGDMTRRLFYAPQRINKGMSIPMALGWHIGTVNGVRVFYKEGGGGGFHSMMRVYPSAAIATVSMSNATGFDVRKLLDAVDPRWRGEYGPLPCSLK
jgi:D-alanyl-D-alanine carboxypeptidase